MSMRLGLLHASKNEDVSREINKSAELSFKTMKLNNPTSLTFKFDDSFVKIKQISISAETLLKNTLWTFRLSN